jgi:hypothetical protein
MKSLGFYFTTLALLSLLTACGKNNESGKQSFGLGNPYYGNAYGTIGTTPYHINNVNVAAVFQHHPCMTTGMPTQQRIQAQFPLTGFPTVIPRNDFYVGVTSSGDVAVLVGQGAGMPPLFVTYMCQRMNTMNGQGQLMDLAFGSYSRCSFKPLTRATMYLPGSPTPLYFRWLDGGTSMRQPFPAPICM